MDMTPNKKKIIAILVILGFCIVIVLQGNAIHKDFKQVRRPTTQNRKFGNFGMYKWMTVEDISKKYHISNEELFKILKITPKPGDEKIPLIDLRKKYNKSLGEMRNNLKQILDNNSKQGKKL